MNAKNIAHQLSLQVECVEQVLMLIKEGATASFIAKYRKEKTGSLELSQVREIIRLHNTKERKPQPVLKDGEIDFLARLAREIW